MLETSLPENRMHQEEVMNMQNSVRLQVEHLHTPVICCKNNDDVCAVRLKKTVCTQITNLVVHTRTIYSRRGRLLSSVKLAWPISVSNAT